VARHSRRPHVLPTPADLETRVRKALREGRTQQALELARQLVKTLPGPAQEALLRQAVLERARHLRAQGQTRDAAGVLAGAAQIAGDAAWYEQLAEELATIGNVADALRMLDRVPDSAARPRVLARVADAALLQGTNGRQLLPEALRPVFDRVVQAFGHAEAGRDEEARAALQEIGLQSPFLEWKLLLRGLLAYYQKDDERAIENWGRLQPDRLPARLAAPLRLLIDPTFRAAQPPQTQTVLQQQVDRLQGSNLAQPLRIIQTALADEDLSAALRQAERLLPILRTEAPYLVSRLASCFYWWIIRHGEQNDVARYGRTFGAPADDPQFARLEALALEEIGRMTEAHRQWQHFEASVAATPTAWPAGQADRVRALVWAHMGRNAANVPDLDNLPELPPFLRDHPDRPRPLEPSAEKCFQRSAELAPDLIDSYRALVQFYLDQEQNTKAEKAARRLLERFPNDGPTLEKMGDLVFERGRYAEALELFGRALTINPLDRALREKIGSAHLFNARTFAEVGEFDRARGEYQAALARSDGPTQYTIQCKWAACEFKAGDAARAEELLQQAHAQGGYDLPIAYTMLIEAIRLKLPRPVKKRFDDAFKAALAEPPTAGAVQQVTEIVTAHQHAGVTYHGQKTHEKKVQGYVEKALHADFSEQQMDKIAAGLLSIQALKLARKYTEFGRRRFPQSPWFPFYEAESHIALGPSRCPVWKVMPLLEEARRLAGARQQSERERNLLDVIQDRQRMVGALNPFGNSLFNMFGENDYDDESWEADDDGW
jgi:tetratricopeptide (TPR) repeat protein